MGKKYAILIGLNYKRLGKSWELYGCINDMLMMQNMLIDAYGFQKENILIFRDDINDPDSFPTYDNLLDAFRNTVLSLNEDDEFFWHYSGHGSFFDDYGVNESDNQDEIIIVYNKNKKATALLDDTFNEILQLTKCKITMIFDSCNSGTMGDLMWNYKYDASRSNNKTISRSQENKLTIANSNIGIFSSARDKELAADAFNNEFQISMGALTMAVLTCLRNNNHNVSHLKLYVDICKYMIENGYEQRPQYTCSTKVPLGKFMRSDIYEIVESKLRLDEPSKEQIETLSIVDTPPTIKDNTRSESRKRNKHEKKHSRKTMRMYFI